MKTQIDLEPFLDQGQIQALQLEIQTIIQHLHLPATFTVLQNAKLNSPLLIDLIQIDPTGTILNKKLIQINNRAIIELFNQCVQFLSQKMATSIEVFIKERNINYVLLQFEQFIKSKCQYVGFAWQDGSSQSGSLWQRLMNSIRNLLTITLQFLSERYEMKEQNSKEKIQNAMITFEMQLKPFKNNLQHMHPLDIQVQQSLLKYKIQECLSMKRCTSETSEAIDQLEELEKMEQEKQNKENTDFSLEEQKFQQIVDQIQTKSKLINLKKESQFDLNHLQTLFQLNQEEHRTIEDIMYSDTYTLLSRIERCFNISQIESLQFAINKPFLDWEAEDLLITGIGKLVDNNYIKLCGYRQSLKKTLRMIKTGVDQKNEDKFLIIALLFYIALEQEYSPLAKKYLLKVFESIELTFTSRNCNYLRGALRQYEKVHLKPSEQAIKLQTQPPYRSAKFEESTKSKIRRQGDYMGLMNQNVGQFSKGQLLKFQRLNYAKPTKNVTFLISGFLSEDTEKDLEWLGVIRAIEDTELYGVVWRSGTKLDLIRYVAKVGGTLALQGLQAWGGNLMAVAQVAEIGLKVINFLKKKQDEKKNNPFWGSLVNANQTGIQLANKLIQSFSDRYITLIGFSMGTQVIASCLQRLTQIKQSKIIFKIVTMGGVAHRQNVQKIIETSSQPLTWINFQSKKDYAVKYVYRVCSIGSKPIGSDGVPQIQGHEILNWQVGSVVNSHMDFRPNLHGLCLIAGLKND